MLYVVKNLIPYLSSWLASERASYLSIPTESLPQDARQSLSPSDEGEEPGDGGIGGEDRQEAVSEVCCRGFDELEGAREPRNEAGGREEEGNVGDEEEVGEGLVFSEGLHVGPTLVVRGEGVDLDDGGEEEDGRIDDGGREGSVGDDGFFPPARISTRGGGVGLAEACRRYEGAEVEEELEDDGGRGLGVEDSLGWSLFREGFDGLGAA
mmetsp:Transcript_29593/g.95414  ORF Transcript_29593/g.95414 Transcript_29593/m.95414 type:complete len:209 (-) Transcript_29593:573-1199(-)